MFWKILALAAAYAALAVPLAYFSLRQRIARSGGGPDRPGARDAPGDGRASGLPSPDADDPLYGGRSPFAASLPANAAADGVPGEPPA